MKNISMLLAMAAVAFCAGHAKTGDSSESFAPGQSTETDNTVTFERSENTIAIDGPLAEQLYKAMNNCQVRDMHDKSPIADRCVQKTVMQGARVESVLRVGKDYGCDLVRGGLPGQYFYSCVFTIDDYSRGTIKAN